MIDFQPLGEDDLPRLHGWLGREHVARWWGEPPDMQKVRDEYLPMIRGEEATEGYLIRLDGRPIGFIQTYRVADWPSFWPEVDEMDAAGMDLLIGEPELIGQGHGPRIIRAFVETVVFARPGVRACWADPDARNRRSVRAFEKAGFRVMRDVWAEDAQATERLVRLGRDELQASDLDGSRGSSS
ncbi:MAG TPA: GNAT family N-acetyltransferase [Thermomicrobiaceae bacterium]|nr:GNAT family N-acetyltransferase [Thermomicrobiaceae bacterium]